MAKNMIRKSLAVAAAGALSVAGLAAPAQAAISSLTVKPIAGTSGNGLLGAAYAFTVAAPGNAGDKISVVFDGLDKDDIADLVAESSADISAEGGFDFSGGDSAATGGVVQASGGVFSDLDAGVGDVAVANNAAGDAWVEVTLSAGEYMVFSLSLDTAAVTKERAVTVTAFEEDGAADGAYVADLESGKTSTGFALTFKDPADVTASLSVTSPTVGAKTADVAVTAVGINNASTIKDGTDLFDVQTTFLGATTSLKVNTWVKADGVFGAAAGTVVGSNFTASTNYYSKVYILGEAASAGSYNSATNGGQAMVNDITDDTMDIALQAYLDDVTDNDDATNAAVARAGSGNFDVTVDLTDSAGKAAVGATVTWTLTEGAVDGLDEDANVAGLVNADATKAETKKVTSVTDADGTATLSVSYSGLAATDSFTIEVSAIKSDGTTLSGDDKWTITGEASALDTITTVNDLEDNTWLAVTKGSAVSVTYQLTDQFGMVPVGTFRADWDASGGNMNAVQSGVTTVGSNGQFTASWVDNSTAASNGADLDVTDVDKYNTTTEAWDSLTKTSTTINLNVTATAATPASVAITAVADDQVLNLAAVTVQDENVKTNLPANTDFTIQLTATVLDADGLAVQGYPVTFSGGSDVYFASEDLKTYTNGSITVYTDASGLAKPYVASNKSGAASVTAVAGAASDSEAFTFAAAKDDTGATWEISAPEYMQAGATWVVVATLKDKWGNTVTTDTAGDNFNDGTDAPTVAVSYAGVGITAGSAPTKTDDNGQLKYYVLLGSNDTGTGTVTVSFDTDGAGFVAKTGTASFTIGSAPADTKVNAGSFKGYVAIYAKGHEGKRLSAKVGKDWVVVPALASNFVRVVEYTGAGYTISVRIYIDRVLVDTIVVTTK